MLISTTATKALTSAGVFAVGGTALPWGPAGRLRPVVDLTMTGLPIGAVQRTSDTPGDLPPSDPLS